MAGIEHTYCNTYKEYLELVEWAKNTVFTCPNGLKLYPLDFINLGVTEECFKYPPVYIMNTSQELDYFLIKYCPIKCVQETLKKAYQTFYNEVKQGLSDYDKFDINKIKIATKYKIIKRPHDKECPYRKSKRLGLYKPMPIWSIDAYFYNGEYNVHIEYRSDLKRFIYEHELCNTEHFNMDKFIKCRSIKAICRQLIKAKIPSITIVKIQGFYVGEQWEIKFY